MEARFSAPVQTGPEAHPVSYTMGTESFPGLKRPRRGADNLPLSSAEVKERAELYLSPPLGLRGLLYGDLYLYRNVRWVYVLTLYGTSKQFALNITRICVKIVI